MLVERRIRLTDNGTQWFIEESTLDSAKDGWVVAKVYYSEEDAKAKLKGMK